MEEYSTVDDNVTDFWGQVDISSLYPLLSRVMQAIMTWPHSNASSERMFSMLKKVSTEQRSNLCPDTVRCLLSFKQNNLACCVGQTYDDDRLKALKKATTEYNNEHLFTGSASAGAPVNSEADDIHIID